MNTTADRAATQVEPSAPAAPEWLQRVCRYLSDTLAEGTANERAIAHTVMRLLPLDALTAPWRDIESDPPPPDVQVLLFCPNRHFTNPARIELREYRNTRAGSQHAWATYWMPRPEFPMTAGECRTDGRCQYAIDTGAEGLGHCPRGKCVMSATRESP